MGRNTFLVVMVAYATIAVSNAQTLQKCTWWECHPVERTDMRVLPVNENDLKLADALIDDGWLKEWPLPDKKPVTTFDPLWDNALVGGKEAAGRYRGWSKVAFGKTATSGGVRKAGGQSAYWCIRITVFGPIGAYETKDAKASLARNEAVVRSQAFDGGISTFTTDPYNLTPGQWKALATGTQSAFGGRDEKIDVSSDPLKIVREDIAYTRPGEGAFDYLRETNWPAPKEVRVRENHLSKGRWGQIWFTIIIEMLREQGQPGPFDWDDVWKRVGGTFDFETLEKIRDNDGKLCPGLASVFPSAEVRREVQRMFEFAEDQAKSDTDAWEMLGSIIDGAMGGAYSASAGGNAGFSSDVIRNWISEKMGNKSYMWTALYDLAKGDLALLGDLFNMKSWAHKLLKKGLLTVQTSGMMGVAELDAADNQRTFRHFGDLIPNKPPAIKDIRTGVGFIKWLVDTADDLISEDWKYVYEMFTPEEMKDIEKMLGFMSPGPWSGMLDGDKQIVNSWWVHVLKWSDKAEAYKPKYIGKYVYADWHLKLRGISMMDSLRVSGEKFGPEVGQSDYGKVSLDGVEVLRQQLEKSRLRYPVLPDEQGRVFFVPESVPGELEKDCY